MKTLAELQQERAAKVEAQENLTNTVKEAKRDFNEEEETRFDGFTDEIKALDKKIERAQEVEASAKRAASLEGKPVDTSTSNKGEQKEERAIIGNASVSKALRFATRGKALEGAEKEMNELALKESRDAGLTIDDDALLHIPMSMFRADAHTVSQDAGEYGGQLVKDYAPRVQMPFSAKTFLERLGATRWSGLVDGDVPLPVGNEYDFSWLEETAEVPLQKSKFVGPKLSPKRLAAAVQISNRLLLQSSVNVEGTVRQLIFAGYDRSLNQAGVNGAGGLEPTGVLNTPGVQQSTIATAASVPTRAMVVELPALIEAANSTDDSLGYLMHPTLKALLQNTKVDAGSGMFLMDGNSGLMGYNAVTSTLVPELSTNQVLIFGDWAQMFIGEWGAMSILSNPYSAARKNSLELVVNAHADVAIAQPNAFAVNKFLTDSVA